MTESRALRRSARLLDRSTTRQFVARLLLGYALTRIIGAIILNVARGQQGASVMTGDHLPGYTDFMAMWDGQWYQIIAEDGYPAELPVDGIGRVTQNPWAFYPIFPMLARAVMAVTGWSFPAAGMTVALLCGFGAAVLIGLLLRERIGDQASVAVVILWGLFPASIALQVAYTEALAVLVLAAFLYALDRENWLAAAGVALVVGFSRPIAIPLGLVAAVVLFARWRGRDERPMSRTEYAQGAVALLCCAIAGWIWPAIAGLRTGRSDAYTATMASWRSEGTITPFVPWLDNARFLLGDLGGSLLLVGLIVGLLAMVLGPWAVRLGLAMRAWCLAYPAYLAAVLDPFTSLFRYLVPLFPLVAVIAGAAGPKYGPRRPYFWVRIGVIAAIFVAGQVWWTVALWEFTPPTDYPP